MKLIDKKDLYGYISQLIIQVLKSKDSETLFTFLLYMQFGIIKAYSKSIIEAKTELQELLKIYEDTKNNEEHQIIYLLYNDNQEILLNIYNNVWLRSSYPSSLKWLELWENQCIELIHKKNSHIECLQILEILKDSLQISNKQLYISLFLIKQLFDSIDSKTLSNQDNITIDLKFGAS